MNIGIGLPATIPGASPRLVVEWAKRADAGPFSCLGCLDRILYDNFEPMTALAAAAAVTERIRLATTVLIAPIRPAALIAKQAATVYALSGGRLVLGLGLGAREDDYRFVGADYHTRGRTLTDQLFAIRELWEQGQMGPRLDNGRPTILAGGLTGGAMVRMAAYADGYIHAGGPPRAFARSASEARAAWEDAERPGLPPLWGMAYFSLGVDPALGTDYLKDYYAFTGAFAERIAAGLLDTPEKITTFVEEYEEAGCDELILFPAVAALEQIDRLETVVAAPPSETATGSVVRPSSP